MGRADSCTKIAFIGNTRLTLKALLMAKEMSHLELCAVFGLPPEAAANKTNYVDLRPFCDEYKLDLFVDNDWQSFTSYCQENNIECVVVMGDSRIVPAPLIESVRVIGNHGAVLPDVQGGASLVWGRLLNNGQWGISLMEIDKKIDAGQILKIKQFSYDESWSEYQFTEKCDDLTVEALKEVLLGKYQPQPNRRWEVRIAKHTDSSKVVKILEECLSAGLAVYLPPRTSDDGHIDPEWTAEFIKVFKIANEYPYPRWQSELKDK